ncbi:MAG: glucose-6-phosphate dehydrogenase [Trueperaceae bacterium]|nr:MAG: glucose-6-phosphate dehydrogenase [Trueperaceae bacterium]
MHTLPGCTFVIFGITGDLAARKLLPALYALYDKGALPPQTRIIGYARSSYSDDELRERLRKALVQLGNPFDESTWRSLAGRISYVQGTYDQPAGFHDLRRALKESGHARWLFYTATPPATYHSIATQLAQAGLNHSTDGWAHLIVEKPFGNDLESARALNKALLDCFHEGQLYRIDHYLAKETAQNLAVLRFANTLFEPIWTNRYIDHVQITMAEPIGIGERGSFYEHAGVIRDVFQNHLLQLAALVAMEPPAKYDAKSVRNEKVKVFEAMACIHPENAVLGQYVAASGMQGYRQEKGVAPDSRQATFAAVQFAIHNWRWSGVPFFIRSGKRLSMKASEIVLNFRCPPHIPFAFPESPAPDQLVLRLIPDEGISFRFNGKIPGQGINIDRISMDFFYREHFYESNPDAYETLLMDAMLGDATLFMRADEVEAQWRIVQPLLERVQASEELPLPYKAGTMGPDESVALLSKYGHAWREPGNGQDKNDRGETHGSAETLLE